MLKKRIIAVLTIKDDIVVQSIGFNKYWPIGKPEIAVEFLNQWGIDEIAFNDISATLQGKKTNIELLKRVSKKCFVPLSVGGGIKTLEDAHNIIQNGGDKLIVNNLLLTSPKTVIEVAKEFGNQCVIGSIDIKIDTQNHNQVKYRPYNYLDKTFLDIDLIDWAKKVVDLGVGELLINSVDKDGSYQGFEIEPLQQLEKAINIPIIALGGAKNAQNFIELFQKTNIDAAAAGNFFHFTEHSVNIAKMQINQAKNCVRLETHANYQENNLDKNGRLNKKEDSILEHLLFVKIEKEII